MSCLHGSIFNVAVDLRSGETFGHAYSEVLSFENRKQMLIPRGFAHESSLGSGTVNKVRTKVRIMSKGVEFGKTKLVAKFVTI